MFIVHPTHHRRSIRSRSGIPFI